ncbi:MAG: hypothetical protein ABEN55_02030 [Bradymonadaceae bacterium]
MSVGLLLAPLAGCGTTDGETKEEDEEAIDLDPQDVDADEETETDEETDAEQEAEDEEELGDEADEDGAPRKQVDLSGKFDEWDTDDDGTLTREEFVRGLTDEGIFKKLDVDDDGRLSEDEFHDWISRISDVTRDGEITREEFERVAATFDAIEPGDFDEWDVDEDQILTPMDVQLGHEDTPLYDSWDFDGDGLIDSDDFGTALYDTWDADDNDFLSEDEWGWGFE